MLTRLARACYRRRRLVVAGWAGVLAGLLALSSSFGGEFVNDFTLPGSESQEATELLAAHDFPTHAGESGQVVFTAADVDDPAVHLGVRRLLADLSATLAPVEVVSPYTQAGSRFVNHERHHRLRAAAHGRPRRGRLRHRRGPGPGPGGGGRHPRRARSSSAADVFAEQPEFSSARRSASRPPSSSCWSRSGRCWRWACR